MYKPRVGDWDCKNCGLTKIFAKKDKCKKCGTTKNVEIPKSVPQNSKDPDPDQEFKSKFLSSTPIKEPIRWYHFPEKLKDDILKGIRKYLDDLKISSEGKSAICTLCGTTENVNHSCPNDSWKLDCTQRSCESCYSKYRSCGNCIRRSYIKSEINTDRVLFCVNNNIPLPKEYQEVTQNIIRRLNEARNNDPFYKNFYGGKYPIYYDPNFSLNESTEF